MLKGFKDFLIRGNVIDLAVAVVIGTAFTAIVTAIVNSVITPLVALFFEADATGQFGPTVTNIYGNEVTFPLGDLISALISFLAVAAVVYFVFVLPMNTFKAHVEARKGTPAESPEEEPAAATEAELLVEIRDLLARNSARD
ncbi:large conductance mechanosensitive channel protein MscL [Microbacterium sp. 1.5R]|uniref:large conductance mechanosensitive channel protein MscL n=1 Tax=Microbacterium sp. 1.5R TaxID=1916917 RepID=UPI0011A7FE40|nr:large conductance mechanosensitive channel protein MscL [Microbacterium sp. 1.5R]